MAKKQEIVVSEKLDLAAYDVLADGIEEIRGVIQANVGSFDLNEFNLPRAVNPSATSTRWEIPGLGDESEAVSEVEGIIVYHKESRAYYEQSYDETGGNQPPDCVGVIDTKTNIMIGEGDPGGFCAKCPFSKFTKDEAGQSEAPKCKLVKQLFILRPGDIMPTLFNAKGGNYRQVFNYLMNLTLKGRLKAEHCVTRIKISADKYKSGRDWKKWNLSLVSPLPKEARAQMDAFHEFLEPILSKMEITAEDVMEEPEF